MDHPKLEKHLCSPSCPTTSSWILRTAQTIFHRFTSKPITCPNSKQSPNDSEKNSLKQVNPLTALYQSTLSPQWKTGLRFVELNDTKLILQVKTSRVQVFSNFLMDTATCGFDLLFKS